MATGQSIEERIRARAHRLWEEEGRPEGRAEAHWEQAGLIVALEDSQHTMREAIPAPAAEPIDAVQNPGELPALTDQGEEQTRSSSPSQLRPEPAARGPELTCGNDAEAETSFTSVDAPNPIVRFASEAARSYAMLLFATAAAAGFAMSLLLKNWMRERS